MKNHWSVACNLCALVLTNVTHKNGIKSIAYIHRSDLLKPNYNENNRPVLKTLT